MEAKFRIYNMYEISYGLREDPLPLNYFERVTEENFEQDIFDIIDMNDIPDDRKISYLSQFVLKAINIIKERKELIRLACTECNIPFMPFLGRVTEDFARLLFFNDVYFIPGDINFVEDQKGFLEFFISTAVCSSLYDYYELGVFDKKAWSNSTEKFFSVFKW